MPPRYAALPPCGDVPFKVNGTSTQ